MDEENDDGSVPLPVRDDVGAATGAGAGAGAGVGGPGGLPPRRKISFIHPVEGKDDNEQSRSRHKPLAPAPTPSLPSKDKDPVHTGLALRHLSYTCPGLAGPDVRMCIEPRSFAAYFSCPYPVVIPVFQRRYCWPETQLRGWWRDATKGSMASGPHTTGKTSFKLLDDGSGGGGKQLLCIDGQQRSTSMALLLAAIRDGLLQIIRSIPLGTGSGSGSGSGGGGADRSGTLKKATACVNSIQSMLFLDPPACLVWASAVASASSSGSSSSGSSSSESSSSGSSSGSGGWESMHAEGRRLETLFSGGARLRPSYVDRRAFYELLTHGLVEHALWQQQVLAGDADVTPAPALALALSREALESPQGLAKTIFDSCAAQLGAGEGAAKGDIDNRVCKLSTAAHNACTHMNIMYCEILTPINLSQVFLWMQEKSLLGMGALLKNDNPGIPFSCGDLARNLLLCPFIMNDDALRCNTTASSASDTASGSTAVTTDGKSTAQQQDQMYEDKWIRPVALPAEGLKGGLDAQVVAFVLSLDSGTATRRVLGSMERQIQEMSDSMPPALEQALGVALRKGAPLSTYARLHGHVEETQAAISAAAHNAGAAGGLSSDGDNEAKQHSQALQEVLQQLVKFIATSAARHKTNG